MATKDTIIEMATPLIKTFFHQKRGYKAGIIISLVLGLSGIILGWILGYILSWLTNLFGLDSAAFFSPTFWMSVMLYLGFAWMMFQSGQYNVEKNYQAVLSFFGTRLCEEVDGAPWGIVQGDGFNWYLPHWLAGGVELVDMKSFPVDLGVEREINSADEYPMRISTDLEIGVTNPFRWLMKKNPLQSTIDEALDQLRYLIGSMNSDDFKDKEQKKVLSKRWREGDHDGGEGDARGLEQEIAQWGYGVYKAQIGNIRPPKEIEDANANKQVEKAQAQAETTEIEHVTRLISSLADGANISAELATDVIQTERGKATRLIVSGGASDLVKAGALVSGMLKEGETAPVPFGPGGRRDNPKSKGK
ncbi:MAG: SPFH domain-containing protein [Patescibacteria group bacterium]